jgi:neutral trehalase
MLIKRDFPKIHFYDQDFVDIYDKTWAWIQDCWSSGNEKVAIVHTALGGDVTSDVPSADEATQAATVPDFPVEIMVNEELSPPVILADSPMVLPIVLSVPGNSTASAETISAGTEIVPEQGAEPVLPEEPTQAEGSVPEQGVEPALPEEPAQAEGSTPEQGVEPALPEEPAQAEGSTPEPALPEEPAQAEGSTPEQGAESVLPEEPAQAEEKPLFNTPHIIEGKFFAYPGSSVTRQADAIYSSFFLVYSNRIYQAHPTLDIFYERQEPNGAIRNAYSIETGLPVFTPDNPEGIGIPLFAWAEFNLYHKSANKKRVKDILPVLHRYIEWIDATFKRPNGLYEVPLIATDMENTPREQTVYPMDFNTMMAINVLYMSALSDILNDKDASFHYKKIYFSLKTRINSLMWNADDGFYYDIDRDEKQIPVKTIAGYWPLLAEIPNDDKAERLIAKLQDPQFFGAPHPFPTLAVNEPCFDENGCGYRGSVYPHLTFMVIKGLERYQRWDLARECAIRHLYFVLDSMTEGHANGHHSSHRGNLWEAYLPLQEGHAIWPDNPDFPRVQYLTYDALSTICLMIENIVGLFISLPRKTVDWIIPNLEIMGVENLSLKKNMITILSNKSGRGWEIHMESEKLYYFTINILEKKKKTLPIPSGKCSMLIDKL